MASKRETVDGIVEHLQAAGEVSVKPMFGEYGLYCGNKMVGTICNDSLFIKMNEPGKAFAAGHYSEAPPYPGAKDALQINANKLTDALWLSELVRLSAEALPAPKPKKPKAPKP